MNIHKNARLTPIGRERLVRAVLGGQTPEAAARAAGVSPRTARKWVTRFETEGRAGLQDRTSRPARLSRPTPDATVQKVIALRRRRFTGKQIAAETGVSPATVSRILKRAGLSRIKDLEPAEPVRRYERPRPGDMLHLDIKKLGRFAIPGHRATGTRQNCRNQGAGWDFVHVAIDDHSRIAFSQIRTDEKAASAIAFLEAAVAYYRSLGVVIERVMTDNVLRAEFELESSHDVSSCKIAPAALSRSIGIRNTTQSRRLPRVMEKVSSIANTGSRNVLALTVLNTSF